VQGLSHLVLKYDPKLKDQTIAFYLQALGLEEVEKEAGSQAVWLTHFSSGLNLLRHYCPQSSPTLHFTHPLVSL